MSGAAATAPLDRFMSNEAVAVLMASPHLTSAPEGGSGGRFTGESDSQATSEDSHSTVSVPLMPPLDASPTCRDDDAAMAAAAAPSSPTSSDNELDAVLDALSRSPQPPWPMPWTDVRARLVARLAQNCSRFATTSEASAAASTAFIASATALFNNFEDYPFTIQRLAELLRAPTESYASLPSYMRAIEKTLTVTSCATTEWFS